MHKILLRVIGFTAGFIFLYVWFGLFTSAAQLANIVEQFLPDSGRPVLIVMSAILLLLGVMPIVFYYRLPQPLIPPSEDSGPEYDQYIRKLRHRLKNNKHLISDELATNEQINIALSKLSVKADALVKQHASSVFVSTALMQNGRLDGLIVLVTQLRMIWLVARIFFQRPSPRQMLYLYGNVGTNVVLAQNIQDIDMSELAAPLVVSIVPSLNGAIPGMQGVSNLILNSLANGSANAFLTLRVGVMARMYCEALTRPKSETVRSGATRKALEILGSITKEQGSLVVKGAMGIVSRKFGSMMRGAAAAGDSIAGGAAAVGGAISGGVVATGNVIARGATAAGGAITGGVSATGGAIARTATAAGGAINKGARGAKNKLTNYKGT